MGTDVVVLVLTIQFFHVCTSLNADVTFVLTNGVPEKHLGGLLRPVQCRCI